MLPRWGQRQYRFRCIEVFGFGAGPGALQRRRGTYVLALATVAPPLAESEAESAEIAAHRRASPTFWALVPKMEAI
jgi:hypothetical protein